MKLIPAVFAFTLVFTVASHSAAPHSEDTITSEVISAIAHHALIVDVRTPEEFDAGHYPGAINIPHEKILDGVSQLGVAKEASVILYCRSGNRSGQAEQALQNNGFAQAKNAGGLEALLSATGERAIVSTPAAPQ